jgi:hypothetical protein
VAKYLSSPTSKCNIAIDQLKPPACGLWLAAYLSVFDERTEKRAFEAAPSIFLSVVTALTRLILSLVVQAPSTQRPIFPEKMPTAVGMSQFQI